MASTNSRIRAAGRDHGIESRRVTWGLIWDPSPSTKRPFEKAFRSWPMLASVMGLRAKATAMAVARSTRSVCSAASTSGKKGSFEISALTAPAQPAASMLRALSGTSARSPNRDP